MKVMAHARGGGGAQQPQRQEGSFLAALKWALRNPNICTVPSMTDHDQLQENFRAMAEVFADTDAKLLAASLAQISPYLCRQCQGECLKGLPVSDMVRFAMDTDGYGQYPVGREEFLQMEPELQQVQSGDGAECAVRCPNRVNVPQQVAGSQELYA